MTVKGDEAPASHRFRALKVALLAIVLGPVVGWTLLYVAFSVISIVSNHEGIGDIRLDDTLSMWALGAIWSYLVGGIPALVAAIFVAWYVNSHGTISYVHATAIAGASGALVALAFASTPTSGADLERLWEWLEWVGASAGLSAASALICRWLAGVMGLLPPVSKS